MEIYIINIKKTIIVDSEAMTSQTRERVADISCVFHVIKNS